jgi:hypothetical protein
MASSTSDRFDNLSVPSSSVLPSSISVLLGFCPGSQYQKWPGVA